ncbi:hypothetical protein PR048_029175 [Dryococelus australis]|uniref:Uncharacterized protein n=1 Tax=Dryococelus australis TaxID=614101 RepID=A0ABQ9GF98_9NEOP|nr:hypothetical protein PR048_029175 [Dryococelus australis]
MPLIGGFFFFSGSSVSPALAFQRCSILASFTLIDFRDLSRRGAGVKGRGKRETPEKTRRPMASSGTIPTCENPVTRPGIEPGLPWWEASRLAAQPPFGKPPRANKTIARGALAQTNREVYSQSNVSERAPPQEDITRYLLPYLVLVQASTRHGTGAVRGTFIPLPRDFHRLLEKVKLSSHFSTKPTHNTKEIHLYVNNLWWRVSFFLPGAQIIAFPATDAGVSRDQRSKENNMLKHDYRLFTSDYSSPTKANRVRFPAGSLHDFRNVEIVLDDAAGRRRVFSGISRFPRSCLPALLHTRLTSLSSALKTSMLRAAQISPLSARVQYSIGRPFLYLLKGAAYLDYFSAFEEGKRGTDKDDTDARLMPPRS